MLGLTGSGLALGTVLLAASVPRGVLLLVGGVSRPHLAARPDVLVERLVAGALVVATALAGPASGLPRRMV